MEVMWKVKKPVCVVSGSQSTLTLFHKLSPFLVSVTDDDKSFEVVPNFKILYLSVRHIVGPPETLRIPYTVDKLVSRVGMMGS